MKAATAPHARPAARSLVRLAGLLWPALALVATGVLLLLALLRPAPYAVDVGAPGDAYALANFHRPEGAFRWSAPDARLLVPAAYDGPLALTMRLQGAPTAPPGARALRIERDGATVAALGTTPGWRVYHLLLPPDAAPEPSPLGVEPLDLALSPTYVPGDARPLGVALDSIELAAAPGPAPLGPVLARATALTWALGLAWALVALLLGWRSIVAAPLLLATGAALALWAWRAPLGFAWALLTPPWWALAAGTCLAAGWWWARARPHPPDPLLPQGEKGAPHLPHPDAVGLLSPAQGEGLGVRGPGDVWGMNSLQRRGGAAPAVAAGAALGLGLGAMLLPPPWSGAGAVVTVLLPGALAAWAIFPEERALAARALLGCCGAVAVAALLLLGLHALPGAPPGWLLVGLCATISALVLWRGPPSLLRRGGWGVRSEAAPSSERTQRGLLVLIGLVAAALRLWQLGSTEFQGDEARAMLLALGVAQGEDSLLLTHTKGPVEALLPAAVLVATGAASEWTARLPFALASLGVLAGALALMQCFGQADEGEAAGLILHPSSFILPLALLAVDGFSVAFGRIVQYQSVVMLMMTGAFWCCWRFYAGAAGAWRPLLAAAVLLAVGLLAHYDAALVAPALAWLVVAGGRRRGWRGAAWARQLAAPALVGAALLASFYLPYLTSAGFGATAEYLAGRAGEGDSGGPPFNNLPIYLAILAFYNAPALAPMLALLVVGSLCTLILLYVKPGFVAPLLAACLALAALAHALGAAPFTLQNGGSWAILAFGLPLAGLCALRGAPVPVRATAIWFSAAFCAQAFLIAEPRTHFYTAHVPAALLVGLAAAGLSRAAPWSRIARRAAAAAALLILGAGGAYAGLAFLQQQPEYQRAYPAARPGWLRGPYGDSLPEAGYFGFPHRDGWKAAAELLRSGALRGSYDTNQNRWLVGWYLAGQAGQCKGQPDLYLIAEGEPNVYFPPGYHLLAQVAVGPGRALAIYGRRPPAGPPARYELAELAAAYDSRPIPPFQAGALLTSEPPACA